MRHLAVLTLIAVAAISPSRAQIMFLPDERVVPEKRPAPVIKKRIIAPVVTASAQPVAASARDIFPRRLRQDELKTLFFTGKSINAHGLDRDTFKITFKTDGGLVRVGKDGQDTQNGKWRFAGDAYCSKWEGRQELCFTVVKDGETYKVVYGTRAVAFWSAPGSVPASAAASAPASQTPFAASANASVLPLKAAPDQNHKQDRDHP